MGFGISDQTFSEEILTVTRLTQRQRGDIRPATVPAHSSFGAIAL